MNINCFYNISFTSRNPAIRKADDIQRRTKVFFPAISSSYIDNFYLSTGKNRRLTEKKESLFEHVCDLIYKMRNHKNKSFKPDQYIPCIESINAVKKIKAGNCAEYADIAVAALIANGYTNTRSAHLQYEVTLSDKKTKKPLYTGSTSLDHTCVLTDMNNSKERNITVDPWLGFADSKSGAIGRYKAIKDKKSLNNALYTAVSDYSDCKYMYPEEIRDEYLVKENIYLKEDKPLPKADIQKLSDYVKNNYPELII